MSSLYAVPFLSKIEIQNKKRYKKETHHKLKTLTYRDKFIIFLQISFFKVKTLLIRLMINK
jgi:hypothetical protein